jgi:hypothetical protein
MFWILALSHLLADYPLQTDRMVRAKRRLPGLALHVGIHWLVMTALTWQSYRLMWPIVLGITIVHFGIDAIKNYLMSRYPERVIGPYFLDQFLHVISLVVAGLLIQGTDSVVVWEAPLLPLLLTGLVLCTYVASVTERILVHDHPALLEEIERTQYLRFATRSLLFLLLALAIGPAIVLALIWAAAMYFYYRRRRFSSNWLVYDVVVSVIAALFIAIPATFLG